MGLPLRELNKMIEQPLHVQVEDDLLEIHCRVHGLVAVVSARGELGPGIVHVARAHLDRLHKPHAED